MSLRIRLALPTLMLGMIAIGCADQTTSPSGTGSAPIKVALKARPATQSTEPQRSAENKITGTNSWLTSKATQPENKALVKEEKVVGKVTRSDAGSITVSVNGGGEKTFHTDANTQIHNSGDPRFFPQPMPEAGRDVTIIAFNKDGRDYARMISIGTRGFGKNENKNE